MDPRPQRPRRTNAILLVAVLLTANLALMASAPVGAQAGIQHAGVARFQELDNTDLPAGPSGDPDIHGTGAVVMMNVTDDDLANPQLVVRVTSTSDTGGEEIPLRRVTLPTGKAAYHGFLGFETTNIPGNGEVFVRDEDKVTLVYIDNDRDGSGTAGVAQDTLRWIESWDGELSLDKDDYFGVGEEAEIQVFDRDIPTGAPFFCVRVSSDSDPDGFNMSLATKVSNGRYRGNLRLTDGASDPDTLPSSTGTCPSTHANRDMADGGYQPRLHVQDGDLIYVEYGEPGFDARGRLELNQVWALFQETEDGRIQFVTRDFLGVVSEDPSTPPVDELTRVVHGIDSGQDLARASAWIRVEDPDLAGRGQIQINVRSQDRNVEGSQAGVDPTGINIILQETDTPQGREPARRAKDFGAGTGEFIGFLGFTNDASTATALRVKDGAVVIARYEDDHSRTGDFTVFESRVIWREHMTGVLDFKTSSTYLTSAGTYNVTWVDENSPEACLDNTMTAFACHPNRGFIELRDTDLAGHGIVTVRVTSSRDPLGIRLILHEADPECSTCGPPFDTGVFRNYFYFNATHSSHSEKVPWVDPASGSNVVQVLWAMACDSVFVEYDDLHSFTGKPARVIDGVERVYAAPATLSSFLTTGDCGDQFLDRVDGAAAGSVTLRNTATDSNPRTDFYGFRNAWVHLFDPEMNLDPFASDSNNRTMTVTSSKTLPGMWQCCYEPENFDVGNEIQNDGAIQINITMSEIGADTGQFIGQFDFSPTGDSLERLLPITDGEDVCVYWLQKSKTTGHNVTVFQHCAVWHETRDAKIEFRSAGHQGASMDNELDIPPETRVFYNGTGTRWTYTQDLRHLDTTQAWVFVQDFDLVGDPNQWANQLQNGVLLTSESDPEGITLPLVERYGRPRLGTYSLDEVLLSLPNSTEEEKAFEETYGLMDRCRHTYGGSALNDGPGTCTVPGIAGPRTFRSEQDDRGYFAVFNFTTELVYNDEGNLDKENHYDRLDKLLVKDGDTISAFYNDPYNRTGDPIVFSSFVDWHETHTAELTLDRELYRNQEDPDDPLNTVIITLHDKDLDTGVTQQTVVVTVRNLESGETIFPALEETGPSTGVFRGEFRFTDDPTVVDPQLLLVADEDRFVVEYTDIKDAHGVRQEREAHGVWFDATSSRLTIDQETYVGYDAMVSITLEDVNLDLTSGRDAVNVWVTSESDGAGEHLRLEETGGRTGVFTAEIGFEPVRVAANAKLHIRDDDRFRVYYLDREGDQDPPVNDDTLVKTVTAVWETAANQPPVLSLETMPPVHEGLGYIPVHVWTDQEQSEAIAFFPSAEDLDGRVEGFTLDFGDDSPLIRQVEHRGPADEGLLHVFSVDKYYDGYKETGEFTVTLTAWDNEGATNTTTVKVRLIPPDTDPPASVTTAEIDENATKTTSITLEVTAVRDDENCDPEDPGCGNPPERYDVRVHNEPITEDNFGDATRIAAENLTYDPYYEDPASGLYPPGGDEGETQRIEVRGLEPETEYYVAVRSQDDDHVDQALAERITRGSFVEEKVLVNYRLIHYAGEGQLVLLDEDVPDLRPDAKLKGHGNTPSEEFVSLGPVTTLAIDTTRPVGTLSVTSPTHQLNTVSPLTTITFTWNKITDTSPVSYYYLFDEVEKRTVNETNGKKVNLETLTLNNVADGTYYFHITACSEGGCTPTTDAGKYIIQRGANPSPTTTTTTTTTTGAPVLDAAGIESFNKRLQNTVGVAREGSDNVITWDLPGDPIIPVAGVQIWRGPDDFVMIADLKVGSAGFEGGTYTDSGAPASATYIVTAYYAENAAMGFGVDPSADIPGFDGMEAASVGTQGDPGDDGFSIPPWIWIVVGIAALVIVLVVIGVLVSNRGGGDDEAWGEAGEEGTAWGGGEEVGGEQWPADEGFPEVEPEGEMPPAAAAAPEEEPYTVEEEPGLEESEEGSEEDDPLTHHLTCPSCGAGFTAHGEKPMVTECPSCGVKGILR